MKRIWRIWKIAARLSVAVFMVLATCTNWVPFLPHVPQAQAAVGFRSETNFNDTSINASCGAITKPSGTTQGDLLIAVFQYDKRRTASLTGWTLIDRVSHASVDLRMDAFYKVAGASEPTTYTFTLSGSSDWCSGGMSAYTGFDTTTPIDIYGNNTGSSTSNGASLTAPSITTTLGGGMLVAGWGTWNSFVEITVPGSMTEIMENDGALRSSPNTGAYEAYTNSGASGTRVATANNPGQWVAMLIAIKPLVPTYTLNAYRWYTDNDAIDPTDPWGTTNIAQNTSITQLPYANNAPSSTDELRLRLNLTVGNTLLATGTERFKLQFKRATDSTCTTGSWTDVGENASTTFAWIYATSTVPNGTTTTASQLSPTSGVLNNYVKSTTSSVANVNKRSAAVGQTMEYDFHITNNSASTSAQYSFRVVKNSGTALETYTTCPTLVTAPVIDDEMRHGKFFTDGSETGLFWADE